MGRNKEYVLKRITHSGTVQLTVKQIFMINNKLK